MMKKLGAVLAMTAVLGLTACGGGSPSGNGEEAASPGAGGELTPVNVGVIPIVDVAPIYLGVQEGIFEEHGLDVELTPAQGGAAIVPAITSGQMDFGFSNVTSLIIARSKGLPLQILASGSSSTGDQDADFAAVMVKPDSGIEEIADLAGKSIAVNTLNNISDSTISAAVEEAGADASTIDYVEMPFPDMRAALEQGNVDAIAAVEPVVTMAKGDGAVPVFSNYAHPVDDLTVAAYFTSDQIAEQKPEETQAFIDAMKESQAFADANPDKVREILPTYTQLDPAVIEQLTLPKFAQEVNADSLQTIADISLKDGLIEEIPDMEALLPHQ
ncbi:putative ABC transporter substrate-binding protein [Arthrobacter crystallopoietes BAB-32]|uniref:Putative ABC transporter substrate-binding protein n=1 Tax=Arthrobacter crystallopoietes BAB-32 TaxID=1246476 RepID=N1VAN4_9MICC|nr:ABC transporter substrate-binding protein [Arthrobacter crystallopoietes]EMY35358.1 putative ABC transporter substrate-binding protein [Arthrobacter crystallopoietes BAB-32]